MSASCRRTCGTGGRLPDRHRLLDRLPRRAGAELQGAVLFRAGLRAELPSDGRAAAPGGIDLRFRLPHPLRRTVADRPDERARPLGPQLGPLRRPRGLLSGAGAERAPEGPAHRLLRQGLHAAPGGRPRARGAGGPAPAGRRLPRRPVRRGRPRRPVRLPPHAARHPEPGGAGRPLPGQRHRARLLGDQLFADPAGDDGLRPAGGGDRRAEHPRDLPRRRGEPRQAPAPRHRRRDRGADGRSAAPGAAAAEGPRLRGDHVLGAERADGRGRPVRAAGGARLQPRRAGAVPRAERPSRAPGVGVHPDLQRGPEFARVLDAVLGQRCAFPYDLLVIDSGSTDGTPISSAAAGTPACGWRRSRTRSSSMAGRATAASN